MVGIELADWLRERFPPLPPTEPQANLVTVNFKAGQQSVIALVQRLAETKDESD